MLAGCSSTVSSGASGSGDTSAPYINIKNYEYTTAVNMPIDFSNITGYDDVDGLLNTEVEGYINYSKPGDYYPTITCTDFSGNESSVGITVHVLDSMDATALPTPEASAPADNEVMGCSIPSAKSADYPCDAVLPADSDRFQTLYEGTEGKEKCEAAAADKNSGTCSVIYRNDGSFWGYGYATAPVQENAVPEATPAQ